MGSTSLKEKTTNGLFWSSVDRFSSQGISFVFSILIARLLWNCCNGKCFFCSCPIFC